MRKCRLREVVEGNFQDKMPSHYNYLALERDQDKDLGWDRESNGA